MKEIISTIGAEIEFAINSARKLVISHDFSVRVTDEEYEFIVKRLGSQVSVTGSVSEPQTEEVPAEVIPEETPEEAPIEAPETEVPAEVIPEETPEEPLAE